MGNSITGAVFTLLGGLALFIFGMHVMTEGLNQAAGERLRRILARTTGNRGFGILLGTALGFLVHSSAGSVMLVGFVNAGLLTLAQVVPPILGVNVGTTLSMQLISFDLDAYCFVAIALGFLWQAVLPQRPARHAGRALMGFGLLFLGMRTMSGAVAPYRELLQPVLARIDGTRPTGMLLGVVTAALLTGVIQSSGATIGMTFALIAAGGFTELTQVFPILLGARIGTCVTALLGSIGTDIHARRTALSHLGFNVLNVALALAAAPILLSAAALSSDRLVRQSANLHTLVALAGALLFLPFTEPFAALVRRLAPSRKPERPATFLDHRLLDDPEAAMMAAVRELQRTAALCLESLRINADLLFAFDTATVRAVKLNEQSVNRIKAAMQNFLERLSRRRLSKQQGLRLQLLDACVIDLERIGDHVDACCTLTVRRRKHTDTEFDEDSFDAFFELYMAATDVLKALTDSLDPESGNMERAARDVFARRDAAWEKGVRAHNLLMDKVQAGDMSAKAGFYYSEYLSTLNRLVRHAAGIARLELMPEFREAAGPAPSS